MPSIPQTALITGSARRIGRAIALDLAAHGWRVAIHYRNSKDEAEALAGEIRRTGGAAAAVSANLADLDEVQSLIVRCAGALGAVTCLVNNASEFFLDTIGSVTPQGWDTHLDINLKAPVFLAQALYANLPEGVEGNVINIIDQRVWRPTPDFFSYTISKAGLWTATQTLAQAMAPRVRVNAIGPGPVLQSVHQTPGGLRRRDVDHAVAARAVAAGDRRGRALHPRHALDDRPDDRPRRWPAPRLSAQRRRPRLPRRR